MFTEPSEPIYLIDGGIVGITSAVGDILIQLGPSTMICGSTDGAAVSINDSDVGLVDGATN